MGASPLAAAMPNYPYNNGSTTTFPTVKGVLHATLHTQSQPTAVLPHASTSGGSIWPWVVVVLAVLVAGFAVMARSRVRARRRLPTAT